MFLKTLQIKGFKSFADVATLHLEPGVTVVVGPNGSGKSNVVDAIGWVLGAQAPSAVRSQKMDDVIFAGSAKRPSLGRAEVALTIDNSSGMLPIEFTEVTITRTLFRSGDSEYAINGVPCRLLDIQELLSDSGVGRQQHVIISQGQIDAVLNAKPEERRLIIEEAAGVLKYRRRKEKAERRLTSTEANLLRIQDLLREVRRQLRPLERQADAARRHGDVVAELTALKIHLTGREVARLTAALGESTLRQRELAERDRALRTELGRLDAEITATEVKLSSSGDQDVSDALVRYESLRERAVGLRSLLEERARGIERDRDAFVDQGVVASLEAEVAQRQSELAQVDADTELLADDRGRLAAAEAELAFARTQFEQDWADGVAAPTGGAAEVRGELAALTATQERTRADLERLDRQREQLDTKVERLRGEADRLRREAAELEDQQSSLADAVASSASALDEHERRANESTQRAAAAADEHHRWAARSDALAVALDEARQRAGANQLAGLDGVIGTLLDVVDVDEGWDAAFEAAVADALGAVVVESAAVARTALQRLVAGEVNGSVLALRSTPSTSAPAPSVGTLLRSHVRGTRPGVDDLLDALVGSVVVVDGDWTAAVDAVLAHPDALVVTRSGDRFGRSGWQVGRRGAGATGAALAEAQQHAERARVAHDDAVEVAREHDQALRAARAAADDAVRASERHNNRSSVTANGAKRAAADHDEAVQERQSLDGHLAELAQRADAERQRRHALESRLPALEAAEAELGERARMMADARQSLDDRAAQVGALRNEVGIKVAGLDERRRFLSERIAQVEVRLSRHAAERAEAAERRIELDARAVVTATLLAFVNDRVERLAGTLDVLRAARRRQSEQTRAVMAALDELRRRRQAGEKELEQVRELVQRAEIGDAETKLRLETVTTTLRAELDTEPELAVATPCPELVDGTSPQTRLRELERDLRLMGPINPLALQEFEALQERHTFLESQLEDIRTTRRELSKVIKAVDEEIVSVFASAYADVATNFTELFETLFPGGQGSLTLTEPGDLLNTGIEIEARPSGKNVRKLSLLSGGERSLTALAYLFAVFRSRPSPFYVMDEVEAALDDVNLHRFLNLVAEFRSTAQLLIVSHQKRTMEAADVLYGVTMEPGGSSKVLSEKVTAS